MYKPKLFTQTSGDIIFAKVKAKKSRVIDFATFKAALELAGPERYPITKKKSGNVAAVKKFITTMLGAGGPANSGTKADYVEFHDNEATYTGVHKNGGPTNVDKANSQNLANLLDRTPANARGVKLSK
jgi:hypothetical protein